MTPKCVQLNVHTYLIVCSQFDFEWVITQLKDNVSDLHEHIRGEEERVRRTGAVPTGVHLLKKLPNIQNLKDGRNHHSNCMLYKYTIGAATSHQYTNKIHLLASTVIGNT